MEVVLELAVDLSAYKIKGKRHSTDAAPYPVRCQLNASISLLNFYNNHAHSSRIISDYCHGKLPLPPPELLEYVKRHNSELITKNATIGDLLNKTIFLSKKFYTLLKETAFLSRNKYMKEFESRIQAYGQLLIDQLYLTRQHLNVIRTHHPGLQFTIPEYSPSNDQFNLSRILRFIPLYGTYTKLKTWIFQNHKTILSVYYSIMVCAVMLSWYLGFLALGHIGYNSNLAVFSSAITAIVTMLIFLGFHPVVDFSNYDIDGKNVLAQTYRKYINSLYKNHI